MFGLCDKGGVPRLPASRPSPSALTSARALKLSYKLSPIMIEIWKRIRVLHPAQVADGRVPPGCRRSPEPPDMSFLHL
ncbi:hypothetical protein E2C01_018349 [Portunus trituberculatus]|uniref:Uncharacterized protein n=1 Tax=Portunus trituberculatus TaxID=210409 RepID=A0A5B7DWL2_PORTR|nr:hypothetical protein [Portunus trituberculatus]